MRNKIIGGTASMVFLLTIIGGATAATAQNAPPAGGAPAPPPLQLTSTAFADSTPLPQKYSCAAQPAAVSPPLQWSDVPKDTDGFVLIVHDMEPRPRKALDDIV